MFNKMITFILALCLFSTSVIGATPITSAVEDLKYSLSVEWDQKDQNFYDKATDEFSQKLIDSGLSNDEILKTLKDSLANAELANNFETLLNNIDTSKMTSEEVNQMAKDLVLNGSAKGASWSGDATAVTFGMVMVAAFIVGWILIKPNPNPEPMCYEENVCGTHYVSGAWAYTCEKQVTCH